MKTQLKESSFLKAFEGTNTTVPVWFMRQAGRYLPEYQAIRQKMILDEMFRNPDVVVDVTCQPIDILGVDAAILFADILTLPQALGFEISFDKSKGPVIANPIQSEVDLKMIHDFDGLPYIEESITKVKRNLQGRVPLIGFAGAPFTVLSYLVEGGSSQTFMKLFNLLSQNLDVYHALMEKLTRNTIQYLNMQKKSGINAFQLFDTWGGILPKEKYKELVLPYITRIFNEVNLNSIYYIKNGRHVIEELKNVSVDFVSLCHCFDFSDDQFLVNLNKGIQGNLFTGHLYSDEQTLAKEVNKLLCSAKKFPKYIFNLSHGVAPNVDVNTLKTIVKQVHSFSK